MTESLFELLQTIEFDSAEDCLRVAKALSRDGRFYFKTNRVIGRRLRTRESRIAYLNGLDEAGIEFDVPRVTRAAPKSLATEEEVLAQVHNNWDEIRARLRQSRKQRLLHGED